MLGADDVLSIDAVEVAKRFLKRKDDTDSSSPDV